MAKNSEVPKSLSEAIEKLESVGESAAQDFKGILETLKPHLGNLQDSLEGEVLKKKSETEKKIKQNPWLTLGVVGILAFVIGLFVGSQQNHKD